MNTTLSPAAQAVLDAFTEDNSLHDRKHNHYNTEALAAALRAAADHVVPVTSKPSADSDYHLATVIEPVMNWTNSLDQYYQRQQTRTELLAIANELEAH